MYSHIHVYIYTLTNIHIHVHTHLKPIWWWRGYNMLTVFPIEHYTTKLFLVVRFHCWRSQYSDPEW